MPLSGLIESATGQPVAAIVVMIAAALVAGLARGFSGFGAALVFVPLAGAAVGPKLAAPVLLLIDLVAASGLLPRAFRHAERRDVAAMLLGALIGAPAGAYLLNRIDPLAIRWGIVAAVAGMLLLLMSGWRYHGPPRPPASAAVGLVSGFFSGIAQMGGPTVAVYWMGGTRSATTLRANIVLFFGLLSFVTLASYGANGLLTRDALVLSVAAGPAYAGGIYGGARMFGLASEATFRRLCFALIAAAAVLGLPLFDAVLR